MRPKLWPVIIFTCHSCIPFGKLKDVLIFAYVTFYRKDKLEKENQSPCSHPQYRMKSWEITWYRVSCEIIGKSGGSACRSIWKRRRAMSNHVKLLGNHIHLPLLRDFTLIFFFLKDPSWSLHTSPFWGRTNGGRKIDHLAPIPETVWSHLKLTWDIHVKLLGNHVKPNADHMKTDNSHIKSCETRGKSYEHDLKSFGIIW